METIVFLCSLSLILVAGVPLEKRDVLPHNAIETGDESKSPESYDYATVKKQIGTLEKRSVRRTGVGHTDSKKETTNKSNTKEEKSVKNNTQKKRHHLSSGDVKTKEAGSPTSGDTAGKGKKKNTVEENAHNSTIGSDEKPVTETTAISAKAEEASAEKTGSTNETEDTKSSNSSEEATAPQSQVKTEDKAAEGRDKQIDATKAETIEDSKDKPAPEDKPAAEKEAESSPTSKEDSKTPTEGETEENKPKVAPMKDGAGEKEGSSQHGKKSDIKSGKLTHHVEGGGKKGKTEKKSTAHKVKSEEIENSYKKEETSGKIEEVEKVKAEKKSTGHGAVMERKEKEKEKEGKASKESLNSKTHVATKKGNKVKRTKRELSEASGAEGEITEVNAEESGSGSDVSGLDEVTEFISSEDGYEGDTMLDKVYVVNRSRRSIAESVNDKRRGDIPEITENADKRIVIRSESGVTKKNKPAKKHSVSMKHIAKKDAQSATKKHTFTKKVNKTKVSAKGNKGQKRELKHASSKH